MSWPRAALFSLSDRSGAAEFAQALAEGGTTILASGGTAKALDQAGGFSELLGGRGKTLHPYVHAPILARRTVPADMSELASKKLLPIDLVAVSLYPFEEKASGQPDAEAWELIDIGGVALLRAAAKNWTDVIAVHDPLQYDEVIAALKSGRDDRDRRRGWARAAFLRTARYDAAIATEIGRRGGASEDEDLEVPPAYHLLALERERTLRYGENPHQPAALYTRVGSAHGLEALREGKELSYNNLLDLESAVALASRFRDPACVIVKHHQPCGAACAATPAEACDAAIRSDELSSFGGVVAFNRPLDGAAAARIARHFVECVAAPEIAPEAEVAFQQKKNLRVVRMSAADLQRADPWDVRLVGAWALLQREPEEPAPEWRVVTQRAPNEKEWQSLRFAWEVAAAASSNAIAIAQGTQLVGLGSGQTSRVDAVDVAVLKARRAGHNLLAAGLASDGFFPFEDNIEHAAQAGVTAFVQPGGSVRDKEVVAACDARGLAMAVTDRRTFRH